MEKLQCVAQTYAWGKRGRDSFVAQLKEGSDASFQVDDAETYAELWMGTHPNGPTRIEREGSEGELLSVWLKEHGLPPQDGREEGDLAFLFKVLSVNKALSIQAHPDRKLAQSLHAKFPDTYKDPNHKPEMAIALTRFEALCQFRPIDEIVAHLDSVPELRALAGDGDEVTELLEARDQRSLREFFGVFMQADQALIETQVTKLQLRLEATSSAPPSELSSLDALVLRLIAEYKADIGCFCPYLLNYITLEPGQAVFLGANEPHAYLKGDCIECMACSDNVVRAGLTPKFIDKATLYEMLTYYTGRPAIQCGDKLDRFCRVYSAPVPEFEVEALTITAGQTYTMRKRMGPSIMLVISGTGVAKCGADGDDQHANRCFDLGMGHVYLIADGEQVELTAAAGETLSAFRAYPNEHAAGM